MRRTLPAVALLAGLLAACSGSNPGEIQRYYDPSGLFTADLPLANDITVIPRQDLDNTPPLLSGVLSVPAEPSPSAAAFGGGGIGVQPATQQDTAFFEVFAVKTQKADTVVTFARRLLSATAQATISSQRKLTVDGLDGILVVADHRDDTGGGYTDASVFLIDGHTGYWVRELFALGEWNGHQDAFMRVARSFRRGVPPGVRAVPVTRSGLAVRSDVAWPIG